METETEYQTLLTDMVRPITILWSLRFRLSLTCSIFLIFTAQVVTVLLIMLPILTQLLQKTFDSVANLVKCGVNQSFFIIKNFQLLDLLTCFQNFSRPPWKNFSSGSTSVSNIKPWNSQKNVLCQIATISDHISDPYKI